MNMPYTKRPNVVQGVISPEMLPSIARIQSRIARDRAAGYVAPTTDMTGGNPVYNPTSGTWKYPAIDKQAWDAWYDDMQAARSEDEAISRRVNGGTERPVAAGSIQCGECRATGSVTFDAGYSESVGVCECPGCNGTGWRK